MDYKDYYQTLGLARDADKDAIQRAYRKLARKYHPDVNKDPDAEVRFKEVTEAYEVLKDPEKRAKYDQFGSAWKQTQQGGAPPPGWENVRFDFGGPGGGFDFQGAGGSGFSSFFEMLFGQGAGFGGGAGAPGFGGTGYGGGFPGGGTRGAQFVRRGADQEARLQVSLEEAATGGERTLTLTDPASGEQQRIRVRIPPGITTGGRVRVAGKGSPGSGGGPAGDLFLVVDIAPHGKFRLEGRDLAVDLPITPWEAALGGQAKVPTLDGSVTIKIPEGAASGQRIRLRGRGFPSPSGGSGDLYAELKIVVPDTLSHEERELFEKLAATSAFAPREDR